MGLSTLKAGSTKLVLLIKGAYWAGLLIIAAMAVTSYLLVQHMLTMHYEHQTLTALINDQKVLSQRIVFLSTAVERAAVERKPVLVTALREALTRFDANYSAMSGSGTSGQADVGAIRFDDALLGGPFHLARHSLELSRNAHALADATDLRLTKGGGAFMGERPGTVAFDGSAADRALNAYSEADQFITARENARLAQMLSLHRNLFVATICIIALVIVAIFRPMSETIRRKAGELVKAKNAMEALAVHDGLTGLHNRTFLTNHFETLIKAAHRRDERLAVLQLDLDRFKQINDTLGHAAGDLVLMRTAERMRAACRASDLCVRLGGDEFVMLLSGAGGSEDINAVAERVLSRINEPIAYEGTTIYPGASAGIAVFPIDGRVPEDLMVHADLALYSAKKQGGGGFVFFSDELRTELEHRRRLEADIRAAIATRGFSVHYQPQVSLRDGEITGVEALARWQHPERGMIAPSEFIPVADRAGLMPAVGRIVMEQAIADAAEWYKAGIRFGRLAINVSGSELRENDFAGHLFATLVAAGLPAQKLSLEIVESVILDDEKTGIAPKLRAIRAAGVHLELDDFGTGYASLSHVNPNEIDRLKIDRRFVQNINLNQDNTKIVRAITELARGLGISIIAEGAETEAELDSLLAIGCEQVQGYSIAFPMPGAETREWLSVRSPKQPVLTLHRGAVS